MVASRLFTIGVVLFLLGIQFRRVETFVLTPEVSRFVEERLPSPLGGKRWSATSGYPTYASSSSTSGLYSTGLAAPTKSVSPPKWLGFSLMAAGAVMVLGYPCFRK